MNSSVDLIVFSHLRWSFVHQRPQHILSRLAQQQRVIFIEEPLGGAAEHFSLHVSRPQQNVLVAQPRVAAPEHGFRDQYFERLRSAVRQLRRDEKVDRHAAWFYTPMALPLLDELTPELVVFDSMDALDAFLNAPPELREREEQLLRRADIVFTGGPSLFMRLKDRHGAVHCFSSSVDAAHFGRAKDAIAEPEDQRQLARPRLGYVGVIDERIDLRLVDWLARSRPEWQIVMVGPVCKIPEASLPRHENLHYLGQKQYAELPAYLAGWDVSLMPFARNDSTRYISPTKVLEYMAAGLPIVSTPIADVAEPYGDIVYLASDGEEFVEACEHALHARSEERNRRAAKAEEVLGRTSWDKTVERMRELMAEAHFKRHSSPNKSTASAANGQALSPEKNRANGKARAVKSNGNVRSAPSSIERASGRSSGIMPISDPVVVIGAGPTGLSAAFHLGDRGLLLEQHDRVGGWCRSIEQNGFTFDFAGHIMFSNDPYVHELYKKLLGDNVHWQNREAWIYSKNVYTRYPFQGALYGLPPEVIKECIVGAIEARFGSLSNKPDAKPACAARNGASGSNGHHANGNGHAKPGPATTGPTGDVKDCCGDGILESSAPLATPQPANGDANGPPRNFEEFIYKVWGAGIAKHFAIPYNRKLWATPLAEMETSWLGGRVPLPDLGEMIEGALKPVPRPMGPNARFGYPLRGGFQALMNGFLPHVKDRLRLAARVQAVSPVKHEIRLSDGEVIAYDQLISTMPLPVLVRMLGAEAPAEIRQAASKLRYVNVRCVNLGVGREKLTEKHWIYYPEETVFHRIFVQGKASPHCNPPGGFGITCEITYSPQKPLPCDGQALIERCVKDCLAVGMIREGDPIWAANQVDMPYAYVVYDHGRAESVALIRKWLAERDIILAGRYSEWEYYNSDHAFLAGKRAAETALANITLRGASIDVTSRRAPLSPAKP